MYSAQDTIDMECPVCKSNKPIHIPFIACAHSSNFCEDCIKVLISMGLYDCPLCRAFLPAEEYLAITGQSGTELSNVSLTINCHFIRTDDYIIIQLGTSSNTLRDKILESCFIGLLVSIIIYPVFMKS